MCTEKPIYKIEAVSESGAEVIKNLVTGNGGIAVREGSAVITDYSFNGDDAYLAMDFVGTIRPQEDLSIVDIREFRGVKNARG